jgi:hypothetical protein
MREMAVSDERTSDRGEWREKTSCADPKRIGEGRKKNRLYIFVSKQILSLKSGKSNNQCLNQIFEHLIQTSLIKAVFFVGTRKATTKCFINNCVDVMEHSYFKIIRYRKWYLMYLPS